MNVGILLETSSPTEGGGYVFQNEVIKALLRPDAAGRHKFIFIEHGDGIVDETRPGVWVRLSEGANNGGDGHSSANQSLVQQMYKAILDHEIDYVIYLNPFVYYCVEIPYMAVVWDLQHRFQPFFPEVSWSPPDTWSAREQHFSYFLGRAAHVLSGTESAREDISFFYRVPKERILLAPHPTPSDCLEGVRPATLERDWKHPVLFYPAQFWPHKNHINLLEACSILKKCWNRNIRLILTGSDKGNEQFVKEETSRLGLWDNVDFRGFVSRAEILSLYSQATCLCYMSLFGWENLPPLEAMALGTPVVAANVRGAKEQLGDGAVLVNGTNPQEIADAIMRVHKDRWFRKRIVKRAGIRASKRTPDAFVGAIREVLDEFSLIRRNWWHGSRFVHRVG